MELVLWGLAYAFIGAFTLFVTGVWARKPGYEPLDYLVAIAVGWAIVWVLRRAVGVRDQRKVGGGAARPPGE